MELIPGRHHALVGDLQQLLVRGGLLDRAEPSLQYDERCVDAVRRFQATRGLEATGRCDLDTWQALEEAEHRLGDRLLYSTRPLLRGDDVSELQLRLGSLGFDAGRTDGIFGSATEQALGEFQRNAGLISDLVCGPDTITALRNLATRGGPTSVAGLREREELRALRVDRVRVALVHLDPAAGPLCSTVADDLTSAGSTVRVFTGSDWSSQAILVNEFDADLTIAVNIVATDVLELCYFSTDGFESVAGKSFATTVISEMPSAHGWARATLSGRWTSLLRETRSPAISMSIGPEDLITRSADLVGAALTRAVDRWVEGTHRLLH